jgi:hypothetical protein
MKTSMLFLLPIAGLFAQDAAPSPQSGITSTLIMVGIALVFHPLASGTKTAQGR